MVKILSWGLTDSGSFPFIEMEYIEGPDICELLQSPHDKIFSLKELLKLADQLAGALAHCHKLGIKHGDVKCNNVKYNIHTGNYVLLDFGLAILTDEQRRSSIRHAGAIEFMAPEQHDGQMLPQTDVYSYGIVLYELLTGQVPFPLNGNGETGRNTVMLAHIESAVPDALVKRRENLPKLWAPQQQAQEMQVPAWLLQVIYKCIEKVPENRYASGAELQEAIVSGSLAATESFAFQQDATTLQTENERLQAQLLQYQQADADYQKQLTSLQSLAVQAGGKFDANKGVFEQNNDIAFVPKKALIGLITTAGLFIVLFAYSFLSRKEVLDPVNTTEVKAYRSPYIYFKPYNYDSVIRARKLAMVDKELLKDSSVDYKGKEQSFNPKKKAKKKRKKFLGIF